MKERIEKFKKFKYEHDNLVAVIEYGFAATCAITAYALMARGSEVIGANQFVHEDGREILIVRQRNGRTKMLKKGKTTEIKE